MSKKMRMIGVSCLAIFSILMITVASNLIPRYNSIIFIGGGFFLLISIVTLGINGYTHRK
ncbi:hypothetical protein EFS18_05395 [Levilactobacillus brevis]|nr:hypothetical protein [Levilactobacillus brevis]